MKFMSWSAWVNLCRARAINFAAPLQDVFFVNSLTRIFQLYILKGSYINPFSSLVSYLFWISKHEHCLLIPLRFCLPSNEPSSAVDFDGMSRAFDGSSLSRDAWISGSEITPPVRAGVLMRITVWASNRGEVNKLVAMGMYLGHGIWC
jgi:hypothetical protein